MKVAVLSDIHGNNYALHEVLKCAAEEGIKKLLILGDFVGYYYNPDEVLGMLKGWDYSFIKGNHENILLQILDKKAIEQEIKRKYGSGHYKAIEKLTQDFLNQLIDAPDSKIENIDGVTFRMCHGAPWSADEYIYPDSSVDVLKRCDDEEAEFVLIGHSHYAFTYYNEKSILVNPGSVGQSKNRGGFAYWAVINTTNRVIETKVTPYDISLLEHEIDSYDPEVAFLKTVLKRNL